MTQLETLRKKFTSRGFDKYLNQNRDRVISRVEENAIEQSILFQVEYREALFQEYQNTLFPAYQKSLSGTFNQAEINACFTEAPNLYEDQANTDIDTAIKTALARGNEYGYKEDLKTQDQTLPARADIVKMLRKSPSSELFKQYKERLEVDIAKTILDTQPHRPEPEQTLS